MANAVFESDVVLGVLRAVDVNMTLKRGQCHLLHGIDLREMLDVEMSLLVQRRGSEE
jgi:hypothetical protein